jgi:hypothetical protein
MLEALIEIIAGGLAGPSGPGLRLPREHFVELVLVPLLAALLALLLYESILDLWPPPPTVLLASLGGFVLPMVRLQGAARSLLVAVLATVWAVLLTWTLVLLVDIAQCSSSSGGCLPW